MTTELWTVGEARPLGAIPRDRAWHEACRSETRDYRTHAYSSATQTSFGDNNMQRKERAFSSKYDDGHTEV